MKKIEFHPAKIKHHFSSYISLEIKIDGIDLLSSLGVMKHAEMEENSNIAGRYIYQSIDHLNDDKLLGIFANNEFTGFLDCDCGNFGCWPFDFVVKDKTVVWHNFINFHRNKIQKMDFGIILI